jgi:hypothetical protein
VLRKFYSTFLLGLLDISRSWSYVNVSATWHVQSMAIRAITLKLLSLSYSRQNLLLNVSITRRLVVPVQSLLGAGFELSKNKWGVNICLFIVIVITHRRLSIINNGGGLKLTPQGIPGHLVWGLSKQLGVQPPNPPAIQTLARCRLNL